MDKLKKQLIKTLAYYGARSIKISKKQEMKLREWIIPYLMDKFELGGSELMNIKDLRKFIDSTPNMEATRPIDISIIGNDIKSTWLPIMDAPMAIVAMTEPT